jgi:hypothetical protein
MLRQAGSLLLRLPGAAEVLQQQAGALALAVSSLQGSVSNAAQKEFSSLCARYANYSPGSFQGPCCAWSMVVCT